MPEGHTVHRIARQLERDLVGHLPVYGVFLALLVYGSDPRTAAQVSWIPSRSDVAAARTLRGRGPASREVVA